MTSGRNKLVIVAGFLLAFLAPALAWASGYIVVVPVAGIKPVNYYAMLLE